MGKELLGHASAIDVCDDSSKGLTDDATVAAAAGRVYKYETGNRVVLRYDQAVNGEAAGYEITSTVLQSIFSGGHTVCYACAMAVWCGLLGYLEQMVMILCLTFFEYELKCHRDWLMRAAIRTTLEPLHI